MTRSRRTYLLLVALGLSLSVSEAGRRRRHASFDTDSEFVLSKVSKMADRLHKSVKEFVSELADQGNHAFSKVGCCSDVEQKNTEISLLTKKAIEQAHQCDVRLSADKMKCLNSALELEGRIKRWEGMYRQKVNENMEIKSKCNHNKTLDGTSSSATFSSCTCQRDNGRVSCASTSTSLNANVHSEALTPSSSNTGSRRSSGSASSPDGDEPTGTRTCESMDRVREELGEASRLLKESETENERVRNQLQACRLSTSPDPVENMLLMLSPTALLSPVMDLAFVAIFMGGVTIALAFMTVVLLVVLALLVRWMRRSLTSIVSILEDTRLSKRISWLLPRVCGQHAKAMFDNTCQIVQIERKIENLYCKMKSLSDMEVEQVHANIATLKQQRQQLILSMSKRIEDWDEKHSDVSNTTQSEPDHDSSYQDDNKPPKDHPSAHVLQESWAGCSRECREDQEISEMDYQTVSEMQGSAGIVVGVADSLYPMRKAMDGTDGAVKTAVDSVSMQEQQDHIDVAEEQDKSPRPLRPSIANATECLAFDLHSATSSAEDEDWIMGDEVSSARARMDLAEDVAGVDVSMDRSANCGNDIADATQASPEAGDTGEFFDSNTQETRGVFCDTFTDGCRTEESQGGTWCGANETERSVTSDDCSAVCVELESGRDDREMESGGDDDNDDDDDDDACHFVDWEIVCDQNLTGCQREAAGL